MERLAVMGFVRWDEVLVSADKGRREVHYYLKRSNGSSDLAVIGKEKSLRHMSYHYALKNRSLFPAASLVKLKSRREVVDWLKSVVVSGGSTASGLDGRVLDGKDAGEVDIELLKVNHSRKMGRYTTEFMWLGSPLKGRKKRKHYQSFSRNGVIVSVHDFVFVLAEEDKRLVAYLEDMYEDSKGNKMVVVRWFHKVDEIGMVLPLNFNDREIFFSLCHQHLSIECIDGLATVLSPLHFEKFLKEAKQTQLEPFVCHKQFENDDVNPFDITQVEGYWNQEILRYMHTFIPSKVHVSSQQSVDELRVGEITHASYIRPKKRQRSSKDDDLHVEDLNRRVSLGAALGEAGYTSKNGTLCKSKRDSAVALPCPVVKQTLPLHLVVGSQVEVLSHDSGIRGCWFRAVIIKKHKDKIKVQYQDIQDAADEAKKLEEWILASKIAALDQLGFRLCDRPSIRPWIQSNKGRVSWSVDAGSVVDVWWHDGWWEGIVLLKGCDDRLHVYFPGENRILIVGRSEIRHSQEWLGKEWAHIKDRPDLAASILSNLETKKGFGNSSDGMSGLSEISDSGVLKKCETSGLSSDNDKDEKVNEVDKVPDLLKDGLFAQLKWKSSRKRRRGNGISVQKLHFGTDGESTSGLIGTNSCERFLIPSSLMVDHENCKYLGDSIFSSSVAPPLTSLVM